MNKFAEIIVIEWKNGKNAETFTSDDDFREGTKTGELAGKTRITWQNTTVEWVKTDKLRKLDNRHLEFVSDNTIETAHTDALIENAVRTMPKRNETDNTDNQDNGHASVEAIETAMKAGELFAQAESATNDSKPTRARKTTSK